MLTKEHLHNGMYQYGRTKALTLRKEAPQLNDTQVLAAETFVPEWQPGIQPVGAVVRRSELDQVYRVLQEHDSTATPEWTPEGYPALFGVCHSTDPALAKPWAAPQGTSGMYAQGECYRDEAGAVWKQVYQGDNVYDAVALAERWEKVE